MSIYYTTSEELKEETFSSEQNIINTDDLPLEDKEFIQQIIDYIPEF